MNKIIDFLNDYRDTIFYGVAIILCALIYAFHIHNLRLTISDFMQFIWVRESIRMFAWAGKQGKYHSIAFFIVLVGNTFDILIDPRLLTDFAHHAFITPILWILLFFNMLFLAGIIFVYGSPRGLMKTYWKELFDYPRKNKPPKNRWETAKRKIQDMLEKFRPDFVPSPVGCFWGEKL